MKLKNITNSDKELTDSITGKRILVKSKQIVELKKPIYNFNSFKLIEEKIILNRKNRMKNVRRLEKNDTSK